MYADNKRWPFLLSASAVFLYFSILCGVHSLQRICHADTAWYLFSIIQGDSSFFLPRPAAIITLWPAIAGAKAELPLSSLITLYSLSFAFAYSAIGLLTVWLIPRVNTVVMMCGALVLSTSITFSNPANEAMLALVLCSSAFCLWYGWIETRKPSLHTAASVIMCIAALAHPSTLFMLLFILAFGYTSIDGKTEIPFPKLIPLGIALFISSIALFIQSHFSESTASIQSGSLMGSGNRALEFFIMHNGKVSTVYIICSVTWIGGLIGVAMQRKCGLLAICALAYPALVMVSSAYYANGESALVLEKGLLPIALIALAPYLTFSALNRNWMTIVASLAILGIAVNIRFNDISFRMRHHAKRYALYDELVSQHNRVLVKANPEVHKRFGITWSSGAESILYLTAISGNGNSATVQILNETAISALDLTDQKSFIPKDDGTIILSSALNPHYFKLADSPYSVIY